MIRLSQPIISDEEINAVVEVLKSGMLVQGKYVEEFENNLKDYMNSQYVLAVSSGTAALHLALSALDIGEGDAVFVPGFTFPATANVVEIQKARTVLVDVNPGTYNIDPDKLEEAIQNYSGSETPKAIIVVHEFGAPVNMTRIMEIAKEHDLYVVEDAACALGATWDGRHVGTIGDIGCFSFHPRKAITTGEGGAVVTNNKQLNIRINLLRNHGLERMDNGCIDFVLPGFNYRMTEFQAVLGIHQLKMFDQWIEKRKKLISFYFTFLENCSNIQLPIKLNGHAWQTFMIVLPNTTDRIKLINLLRVNEIESNLGAQALHMLSYYKNKYGFNDIDYKISNRLFTKGLALPLSAQLTEEDISRVCTILKENL